MRRESLKEGDGQRKKKRREERERKICKRTDKIWKQLVAGQKL